MIQLLVTPCNINSFKRRSRAADRQLSSRPSIIQSHIPQWMKYTWNHFTEHLCVSNRKRTTYSEHLHRQRGRLTLDRTHACNFGLSVKLWFEMPCKGPCHCCLRDNKGMALMKALTNELCFFSWFQSAGKGGVTRLTKLAWKWLNWKLVFPLFPVEN